MAKKKYYKKSYAKKAASKGRKTKKYGFSSAEKRSYKKGFLKGLLFGGKKKALPKDRDQRHNVLMRDDVDYKIAFRYAGSMGDKFDLSDNEVLDNAFEHYQQMKKDDKFKIDLYKYYG